MTNRLGAVSVHSSLKERSSKDYNNHGAITLSSYASKSLLKSLYDLYYMWREKCQMSKSDSKKEEALETVLQVYVGF